MPLKILTVELILLLSDFVCNQFTILASFTSYKHTDFHAIYSSMVLLTTNFTTVIKSLVTIFVVYFLQISYLTVSEQHEPLHVYRYTYVFVGHCLATKAFIAKLLAAEGV